MSETSMAAQYKKSYDNLFAKLPMGLQKRVLQSKEDNLAGRFNRDPEVNAFIRQVIAEAEAPAPAKKV